MAVILSLYVSVLASTILNRSAWESARKAIRLPGITKTTVVETLAAFQALSLLAVTILPRRDITVSEQAEYEVLLTLPVTMQEYMLGRSLHSVVQSVLVQSVFIVPGAFYAAVYSQGNTLKVALFPAALLLWIIFTESLERLISCIKVATGKDKAIRGFALAYVLLAALEFAVSRTFHLLTAPTILAVQPLVHCFTAQEPVGQVAWELVLLGLVTLALMCLQYMVSSRIRPENVKPLSGKAAIVRLGVRLANLSFYSEKPEASMFKVLLLRPLLGVQGLILASGLVASLFAGMAVRGLFPVLDPYSIVAFAVILILMITLVELQLSIQEDLSPIWLYRVSMSNLKPLARILTAKISLYTLSSFLAGGLFLLSSTGECESLLLPIVSLPSSVLTALLTLGVVAVAMTRRRIVRFSSRGFYLIEDTLALIILAISVSLSSLSVALFQMLHGYTKELLLLSAVTPVAAVVLYFVGTEITGDMLTERDVSS